MNDLPLAMTQSDFAKSRGVSKMAVSQWKKKGLLVFTSDGLVDVAASTALIDSRPVVNRGGKAARQTALPEIEPGETPEQAAERLIVSGAVPTHSHAEAARIKENYLALLRQLEYDRESGAVVEVEVVAQQVAEQFAVVRSRLLAIPSRVAPRIAVLTDAEEVRALIDEEVALALQELTIESVGASVSGRGRKPH